MPADGDGVAHAGARAEARCTVKAHDVHINAWDIPSAITAGDDLQLPRRPQKLAAVASLDSSGFTVRDQGGTVVASGRLRGAIWPRDQRTLFRGGPGCGAADVSLHHVDGGVRRLEQRDRAFPGVAGIHVRTVAAPDHEITIEVVDRDSGAPLEGVNLIMHPYRATTDRNGRARMKVTADHYVLNASGFQRMPYRDDEHTPSQ